MKKNCQKPNASLTFYNTSKFWKCNFLARIHFENFLLLGMVAHPCNPNYSRGLGRRIMV
jgi:hypothetical protein